MGNEFTRIYRAMETITKDDRLPFNGVLIPLITSRRVSRSVRCIHPSFARFEIERRLSPGWSSSRRSGNIFVRTAPEMIASRHYYGTEGANRPITNRGEFVLDRLHVYPRKGYWTYWFERKIKSTLTNYWKATIPRIDQSSHLESSLLLWNEMSR